MAFALSVVIITRDEERYISRAIRSVAGLSDDILVIDSESVDCTRELALSNGARVRVQPWLGWVAQKNFGATLAAHDWILFIDADEIVTPNLAGDIRKALAENPDPKSGFAFERLEEFLGEIMPSVRRRKIAKRFIRIFNRRFSHWDERVLIHEGVNCQGQVAYLPGKLLHWRNYTIDEQMKTLNKNAYFEAQMILADTRGGPALLTVAIKPILRFFWVFVVCGTWRLGMRGYLWAGMNAVGEFLRQAKAWEAKHAPRVIDPPAAIYRASDGAGTPSVLEHVQPSTSQR